MFENLSDRLGGVFDRLTKQGALSEDDVTAAMREVRVALLEADVALPVVKDFVNKVKERAVGTEVEGPPAFAITFPIAIGQLIRDLVQREAGQVAHGVHMLVSKRGGTTGIECGAQGTHGC